MMGKADSYKAHFPVQCGCGHIFLERYRFSELNDRGEIGFCWCGFCRTRYNVKPINNPTAEVPQ